MEQKGGESLPAQTIHFGPVYQAEVGTAFAQTYNSPLASAGDARAASQFSSDVPHMADSDEDYISNLEDGGEDDDESIFSLLSPPPADPILAPADPILAPALPAKPPAAAAVKASVTTAKASAAAAEAAAKHALALATLTATYNSQTPSSRWHLKSSSRAVETVIYESCLGMDAFTFLASLAPSFILDVSDTTTLKWFTEPELAEIMGVVPNMPTADIKMVKSLTRFFPAKTTVDLREVLTKTSFLDEGEVYNRDKHFDACWADLVVRLM